MAVDKPCLVKSNSGSDENPRGAVALQQHAQTLSGGSNNFRSIQGIAHLPFCDEEVS